MEGNFRNVLIILSAIVIIAIFFHGVWTIRKQKNPYKLKATKNKVAPLTRDFDKKGFDQDGVSQIKVSKNEGQLPQNNENARKTTSQKDKKSTKNLSQSQVIRNKDIFERTSEIKIPDVNAFQQDNEPLNTLDNRVESDWFKDEIGKNAQEDRAHGYVTSADHQFSKDELGDDLTDSIKNEPKVTRKIEPLYDQPVTQAKPARTETKNVKKPLTKAELKRDQIEINFDNQRDDKTANMVVELEKTKVEIEPQVIILSVVMPANQQMLGAVLLPSLLTLGLKYGEMNIFHRHEDNAGNGKVTFSLANILNPGTFDLDSMENFATRGVSLFMTLPNAGESSTVFEQMLNAAKQLGQEFNAQVLDDKRNVLTKQSEQNYFDIIREFDRKSRIALAE